VRKHLVEGDLVFSPSQVHMMHVAVDVDDNASRDESELTWTAAQSRDESEFLMSSYELNY
jgi:hypothetical protein